MLEAAVFMSAKGELPEENQIALLLIHEEKMPQEGMRVETVLLEASNFQADVR